MAGFRPLILLLLLGPIPASAQAAPGAPPEVWDERIHSEKGEMDGGAGR
jgi:hypothetical protein